MTRGVYDGDVVFGGLELPKSDIDGDTSLSLSLEFVENPCVLEGCGLATDSDGIRMGGDADE